LLIAAQTGEAQTRGTWLVRLDGTVKRLSPHTLCDLALDGQRMLARTQDGSIVEVRLADGAVQADLGRGETAAWRPPYNGPPPAAPLAAKSPRLALSTPPIQGEAIRELQQQLKALGYDPGPSDGVYGEQTADAVRRFQKASGLSSDGIVGPQTWGWLRLEIWQLRPTQLPAPPAAAPATPGVPLSATFAFPDSRWQLEVFGDPSHPQAVVAGSAPTIERYHLNGDRLELIYKNGNVMRFKALK
jgi:hypothetical protein